MRITIITLMLLAILLTACGQAPRDLDWDYEWQIEPDCCWGEDY